LNDWYHAPPPGSRSGVADYAETLRRELVEFGTPHTDLYHLGNNGLHSGIYRKALERPGVIVLHDAVLHHFLLGQLTREHYIEEFVYNYGEWRRPLAESLWDERGSSGVDPRYFEYPLLKRVVERSRAVIVHNPGAASMVRAHAPHDKPVHIIPHFFEPAPLPEPAETARFRQSLGVGQGTTLFGIFGYLRETKRILPCLAAFRRLSAARPDTALLLAGSAASSDLQRLLDSEATHPGIHRMGHVSDQDLMLAGATIDCCLNLRYPAAGETSGIAMRMMGLGKPVIVSAGPENGAVPSVACLSVAHGVAEQSELFDYMMMVAEFPRIAKDIGAEARKYVLARHSLPAAAREYRKALCADHGMERP
jgi:glycosyltransferase involved in cell wall biosynthesis